MRVVVAVAVLHPLCIASTMYMFDYRDRYVAGAVSVASVTLLVLVVPAVEIDVKHDDGSSCQTG